MVPNSAFITVGESQKTLVDVANGAKPGGEYPALRHEFSQVLSMVERGVDPSARGSSLKFAASCSRLAWHADNIYLGEEFPGIEYLAIQAVLRRPQRIAMLIHNVASLKRRLPLASLRLGQLLNRVLCLSDRSRQELEHRYKIDPSRIIVVGSRVDTEFFTPNADAVIEAQVCSAGAVNRDYETLIAATEPLGIPTKIAADTAWRYSVDDAAVLSRELPGHVEMRSWGTYVNLRELYATSAVVVVPLRKPMLSGVTVALEAMAMGRPVILTRNEYIEDFLIDGENGFFVPPGDAEAIRERVRYLLDHPAEAERVGTRAREWVQERFSIPSYTARILGAWD